jgi:hypothetical protein
VRVGGIYALQHIAHHSEGDREAFAEILTAYVRNQAEWTGLSDDSTGAVPDLRERKPDVQAVMTVLGR